MKRILMIEDDPLVLRLYSEALERQGMEIQTAADGLEGMRLLAKSTPDLVVLDLMMPRMSGQDVLKFMRARHESKYTPVIVFSNSYLTSLTEEATALGVDRAVLKTSCSAPALHKIIMEVLLEREKSPFAATPLIAKPEDETYTTQERGRTEPQPPKAPAAPKPPTAVAQPLTSNAEFDFRALARQKFLAGAETRLAGIWKAYQDFHAAPEGSPAQLDTLKVLYRNIHSLTTASGLANSHSIAQLSLVFEALLHQLVERQQLLTPSILRTISTAIDVLTAMFGKAADITAASLPPVRALVVDDDEVSVKALTMSLHQARLDVRGVTDPVKAVEMLTQEKFDLVLVDVEMPGMTGMDVCKRLRKMPGYEAVPVIYVTAHADFETRARSILSGGTDLIAKPIFPLEVATKAVMHLLISRPLQITS